MRPRYADLFQRMRDPDPVKSDAAFDAVLFDRGHALPDIVECYKLAAKDHVIRFYSVQLLGFSGCEDAIPTLLVALDDPEPMVRAEVCSTLEAHLHDIDPDVAKAAREAFLLLARQ
jgi:hypothetical protein